MTWRVQNCSISTNINSWIFSYCKTSLTEQDVKYKHNRIIMNCPAKWIQSLCCFYIILEGQKKKTPLEYIVPSWDSNPAPPKLASHISVKLSHLVNCIRHAHSMWKYGTGFVRKSISVMGKQVQHYRIRPMPWAMDLCGSPTNALKLMTIIFILLAQRCCKIQLKI